MAKDFPIAEIFTSPQGEGRWAGHLMAFVRLAGCTVGRPFLPSERAKWPGLSIYQEKCCSFSGEEFACDTNYQMSRRMTLEGILEAARGIERVCITGGEPLIHVNLRELVRALLQDEMHECVHIETSGTLPVGHVKAACPEGVWLTVSPKKGYLASVLEEADEIKILVGEHFDEAHFQRLYARWQNKICISAINYECNLSKVNMELCVALQKKYPKVMLTTQNQKVWGVR